MMSTLVQSKIGEQRELKEKDFRQSLLAQNGDSFTSPKPPLPLKTSREVESSELQNPRNNAESQAIENGDSSLESEESTEEMKVETK